MPAAFSCGGAAAPTRHAALDAGSVGMAACAVAGAVFPGHRRWSPAFAGMTGESRVRGNDGSGPALSLDQAEQAEIDEGEGEHGDEEL